MKTTGVMREEESNIKISFDALLKELVLQGTRQKVKKRRSLSTSVFHKVF